MQQINFYTDEFRPQRHYLSFQRGVALMAILFGLGIAWGIGQQWQVYRLQQDYQAAEQEIAGLQQQQDRLAITDAARKPDPNLPNQLQQRQSQAEQLWRLQAILQHQQQQDAKGFSPVLSALAEQAPRDLWLQRIQTGSQRLLLEGQLLQPESLGAWIQALAKTRVFASQPVRQLEQHKTREQTSWSFSLTSFTDSAATQEQAP